MIEYEIKQINKTITCEHGGPTNAPWNVQSDRAFLATSGSAPIPLSDLAGYGSYA